MSGAHHSRHQCDSMGGLPCARWRCDHELSRVWLKCGVVQRARASFQDAVADSAVDSRGELARRVSQSLDLNYGFDESLLQSVVLGIAALEVSPAMARCSLVAGSREGAVTWNC